MKKSVRRALAFVLCAVMLLAALPFASLADEDVTAPADNAEQTENKQDTTQVAEEDATVTPFTDVKASAYYADAVEWAYHEGITTGTTAEKFAPDTTCTRGQVVTFLWRAMGEPEPTLLEEDFDDVVSSDYFYKAVLWAIEKGITNGTSAHRFSPDVTCTNAHIITFIWRAMGEPLKTGTGEWYYDSVKWAKSGGLVNGTYEGEFDPMAKCPRANVVTYLYRYLSNTVLTLYVSKNGNDVMGDGSAMNPYGTIEAARDAIRKLDKSKYTSIRVRIGRGTYSVNRSILFTEEDSGTESCTITYIGEEGAVLTGGVTFSSAEFKAASGDTMQYFPEEVREKLVMLSLTKYGIKANADEIREIVRIDGNTAPFSVNGENQTVARYPNDEFALTLEGSRINVEGGADKAVDYKDTTTIFFDKEHMEHVKTWHDLSTVYTNARYSVLWCHDNSNILSIDEEASSMTVPFVGGHDPHEGMPFYWYNIPEELDMPGEYYIDENAVLYYYPTEDFEGATCSLPVLNEPLIKIDGASYLTFSDLTLEAGLDDGIDGEGDHITVKECVIRSFSGDGIDLIGMGLMISSNEISYIGKTAIDIGGGDEETLTRSDNVIYNNYIHDWSVARGTMCYAVALYGCGGTVSHNDCVNSVDMAISYGGPYHTIEYNYCADTCQFFGDGGVIGSGDPYVYGTVVRYNYVKNGGFTRDQNMDSIGVQGITVDCGQAGLTAYGNVIENVTGSGFGICGGRDHYIYGNLFIQCKYGIFYDSRYYASIVNSGGGNRISPLEWHVSNKYWTSAFPILKKLTFDDGTNFDKVVKDKNFNAATVSVVVENKYYLDKAVSGSGVDPYSIENYVYDFATLDIPNAEDGTLVIYSSKRTEIDVEICIQESQDVIAITPEQFAEIGRVSK